MTFPTVHGAVTTDTSLTTTPAINLPASMVVGSLCFVFFGNGATEAPTADLSAWMSLGSQSSTGYRQGLVKVVDGSEGSTLSLGTLTTSTRVSAVAFEVRGWYGGTLANAVKSATINTYTGTSGTTLACPTLNPDTWDVEDTRWLTAYLCDAVNTLTTAPNGSGSDTWTEVASVWTSQSASACTSVYSRNEASASINPGNFVVASQRVGAIFTVGIRPAGASLTKKLKVQVQPTAAGAAGIEGVVFSSSAGVAGTEIGEFTGATFESLTEGVGLLERAILKVPVADFGGSALNVNDTVYVCVRNSSNTTGIIPATIIEE